MHAFDKNSKETLLGSNLKYQNITKDWKVLNYDNLTKNIWSMNTVDVGLVIVVTKEEFFECFQHSLKFQIIKQEQQFL